jgi:hypothetical protein
MPDWTIPGLVYILCAVTSLASAFLLLRAARHGKGLLLWTSSICFLGMAANNVMLFITANTPPEIQLEIPANITALASALVLLIGLIWDAT